MLPAAPVATVAANFLTAGGGFLFGCSFAETLERPVSCEDLETLSNSDLEPPFIFLCCWSCMRSLEKELTVCASRPH